MMPPACTTVQANINPGMPSVKCFKNYFTSLFTVSLLTLQALTFNLLQLEDFLPALKLAFSLL
jgi:hypothetical protein